MISKKENVLDNVVYIIFCIITGGAFWLTRIVISQAIRKAIKNSVEK